MDIKNKNLKAGNEVKEESVKETVKKEEPKKQEVKKEDVKKQEPVKQETKKQEPKKADLSGTRYGIQIFAGVRKIPATDRAFPLPAEPFAICIFLSPING